MAHEHLYSYWSVLYPDDNGQRLKDFIKEIDACKQTINQEPNEPEWYKDAVVYSLYVDLFGQNFPGLIQKLGYLKNLGITCLWLLPVLDSPMKDAGFDIRDYRMIRKDLTGLQSGLPDEEHLSVFKNFITQANEHGIKVIFDIALNHTSNEHSWFQESRKSPDNPYRKFYIWNNDDKKYGQCRLLFKGMCPSNWEKDGEWYYFHRFFEYQPDLNYRNPDVLLAMCRNLLYWLEFGIDGFRADAIPYLWKQEGTDCENLPETHIIVKFIREVLDCVRPNTLLLAEACQPPYQVVKYFGDNDECNAAYHFPLMPQIFKSLALQSNEPLIYTLSTKVTPVKPKGCQWFIFLRCHDELSLEHVYVSEKDRKYIYENYCHKSLWDFRVGEGISARLAELLEKNPQKILLAFSIMFTLPGTPVIYYGDEFGKLNDENYYFQKITETGHNDTRFLVRGKIDWVKLNTDLSNHNSFSSQIFNIVRSMVNTRNKSKAFRRGNIEWLKTDDNILSFIRSYKEERFLILHNLSQQSKLLSISDFTTTIPKQDIINQKIYFSAPEKIIIPPLGFFWFNINFPVN
ncbi:MAG: alpha-glucosidase C-terminal domain-containing protein [Bacteroidia bacterium]|nr:alpha-glucosidase C-terminal domain-containing protein [Bacteroidia bacterium]